MINNLYKIYYLLFNSDMYTKVVLVLLLLACLSNAANIRWGLNEKNIVYQNDSCNVPDCHFCSNGIDTCTGCDDGFYLLTDKKCQNCQNSTVKNIPNCANCTYDNSSLAITCQDCNSNFFPVNTGSVCQACNLFITDCDTCIDNATCGVCSNSTYRNNSGAVCTKCTNKITDCILCNASDSGDVVTCNSCNVNMYLLNNACVGCANFVSGCAACDYPTQKCIECNPGLYLANNKCVDCTIFIHGCTACDPQTQECTTCGPGYYLNNNGSVCSPCNDISHCANCTSIGLSGANLTCIKCEEQYLLETDSCIFCSSQIPQCLLCDTNNNSCITCNTSYFKNSTGRECVSCQNGVKDCKVCKPSNENGTDIQCQECAPNFFLIDVYTCQACSVHIQNCLVCNVPMSTCLTCVDAFYSNTLGNCSLCNLTLDNCIKCSGDQTNLICLTCSNDLIISEAGKCVTCGQFIGDCDGCTQDNVTMAVTCNHCGNGKVLSDNSCQDSSASTIIIVSAVVGGVVLLGAGFAIFKCMKKRKGSPLAEDDYEKI